MGAQFRLAELTQLPGCDQKQEELGRPELWGCDDKCPLTVKDI